MNTSIIHLYSTVEVTYTESTRVMFMVMREVDGVTETVGTRRNWEEGVLKACLGRMELGDVLLELGTMAMVFDEEASIPLICNLRRLSHNIIFSFEHRGLVPEYVICGHGVCEGLRPCREVNSHNRELCFRQLALGGKGYVLGGEVNGHNRELFFRQLALGGEAYVLGGEFGVGLCCLFLVVLPHCLGSVDFFVKLVASGLFNEQFRLEGVKGSGLARVGMMGVS